MHKCIANSHEIWTLALNMNDVFLVESYPRISFWKIALIYGGIMFEINCMLRGMEFVGGRCPRPFSPPPIHTFTIVVKIIHFIFSLASLLKNEKIL